MSSSYEWFATAAKELDQIAAQLVKSLSRKAVAPISHTDEAQLLNLSQSLNAIAATARNSVVWRCGVAAVCGVNPASLDNGGAADPMVRSSSSSSINSNNNNSVVGGSANSSNFHMTNLDSRISVIARITDLLSLIFVAHDYFAGSDHEAVLRSNTVTILAVVAGACDVPFLPQPICASALEALSACLTDVTAVVHAEQSVLSSDGQKDPPRRFPLVLSVTAQRYMLKSLSKRIFTPQYSSWLISALGAPDKLSPYPGTSASMLSSSSSNNHPTNVSLDDNHLMMSMSVGGTAVNTSAMNTQQQQQQQQQPQQPQQQHSCLLKDAILRICCGAFMGDGPKASPHSYVATSLHVLSMLLLTPIDKPEVQQQYYDRRAPQIFGGSSVEGIATILEALTRRVAAPFQDVAQQHRRNMQQQQQHHHHHTTTTPGKTGATNAAAVSMDKVIRQNKRLLKFFWNVRPLVETLASGALTRKAFIASESTRSLFDFVWKTIAGLIEAIAAERESARNAAVFHTTADGGAVAAVAAVSTSSAAANAYCSPALAAAVLSACTVLLPIGCSIWRAVSLSSGGGENREFTETVALFAAKAAPLLVPAPAARFVVDPSNSWGDTPSSSSLGFSASLPFFSSYDSLLAFDALVDAVEYAAGIESSNSSHHQHMNGGGGLDTMMSAAASVHSSLREYLSHASPQGTLIAVRAASDSVEEQSAIIQSQWAALLLTLGTESAVARCRLASFVEPQQLTARSNSSTNNNMNQQPSAISFLVTSDGTTIIGGGGGGNGGAGSVIAAAPPVHLIEYTANSNSGSAAAGGSTTTVVVDTALRDAVRTNDDFVGGAASSSTPDTVLGCLVACSGSPLAEDMPRWMPNAILRRALLRLACRASVASSSMHTMLQHHQQQQQQQLTARDICRVFVRPPNFAAAQVNNNHGVVSKLKQATANGISLSWPPVITIAPSTLQLQQQQQQAAASKSIGFAVPALDDFVARGRSPMPTSSPNKDTALLASGHSSVGPSAMERYSTTFATPSGLGIGAAGGGAGAGTASASSSNSAALHFSSFGGGFGFPKPQALQQQFQQQQQQQQQHLSSARSHPHAINPLGDPYIRLGGQQPQQQQQQQSNDMTMMMMRQTSHHHHHHGGVTAASGGGGTIGVGGVDAIANALRIELAEQKAVNFELQREIQKRSSETGSLEARVRQLMEKLSSAEMELQQYRATAETTRQLLDQERAQKSQMFQNESMLRSELAMAQGKLRELESMRYDVVHQAEARANQLSSQLMSMQSELEMTRRNLMASEERVKQFQQIRASMRDLMGGL